MPAYNIKLTFNIGFIASDETELHLKVTEVSQYLLDNLKDFKFVKEKPKIDAKKFKLDPVI